MFGGIVEGTGKIQSIQVEGTNKTFQIQSPFEEELAVDQSIAHNGVCLTVEDFSQDTYQVTAIQETLDKSNLGALKEGDEINLERSLTLGSYVDGHLVQGHVDDIGYCQARETLEGSWEFTFEFNPAHASLLVEKGSITINGISLTAHDLTKETFKVSIIPYTFYHTNLQSVKEGDSVNLEFDLIGKYILRQSEVSQKQG